MSDIHEIMRRHAASLKHEPRQKPMKSKNCLSYWYPMIKDVVPTPKTEIILCKDLSCLVDGIEPEGIGHLVKQIEEAVKRLGPWDVFLRTGHFSGKHEWKNTCMLKAGCDIRKHVENIVNMSAMVDFLGLPTDVWCVRELLDTIPLWYCDKYGDMPVCKEFRFFVESGSIMCWHPYWPKEAILQGSSSKFNHLIDEWYDEFTSLNDPEPSRLAKLVSNAVPGAWSVDILFTKNGWFVTDMAEADRSWHWPNCANAKR